MKYEYSSIHLYYFSLCFDFWSIVLLFDSIIEIFVIAILLFLWYYRKMEDANTLFFVIIDILRSPS